MVGEGSFTLGIRPGNGLPLIQGLKNVCHHLGTVETLTEATDGIEVGGIGLGHGYADQGTDLGGGFGVLALRPDIEGKIIQTPDDVDMEGFAGSGRVDDLDQLVP